MLNTQYAKKSIFALLLYNCILDASEKGEYNVLMFRAVPGKLTGSPSHLGYTGGDMILGVIHVLGLTSPVNNVTVNGCETPFTYNSTLTVSKNVQLTGKIDNFIYQSIRV